MKRSEPEGEKATRQCWDCRKRRLACDRTLPSCKKCRKANRECSGYSEQKPLLWVQNGKVSLRPKNKDRPSKHYIIPVEAKPHGKDKTRPLEDVGLPTAAHFTEAVSSIEEVARPLPSLVEPDVQVGVDGNPASFGDIYTLLDENLHETETAEGLYGSALAAQNISPFVHVGRITELVQSAPEEPQNEGARPLSLQQNIPQSHDKSSEVWRIDYLPIYDCLSNETSEFVQAVSYHNRRIFPEMKTAGELSPNPATMFIPVNFLHFLPSAMHHTMVCMALNHFIHTLPPGVPRKVVSASRLKIFDHRGSAIRALNSHLEDKKTQSSDWTISSILMFMTMELQDPEMSDWRTHTNGMQRLLALRGGPMGLLKQSPHLGTTVVYYQLMTVLSNTCSPAWDQLNASGTPEQTVKDVKLVYETIFPYILCPADLFFSLMSVSNIRAQATTALLSKERIIELASESSRVLSAIESFLPSEWAQSQYYDDWVLIGTIFKSAVATYCIMSLRSLDILLSTPDIIMKQSVYGDILLKGLETAVRNPRLIKFILWPTIVAGVFATDCDRMTKDWIWERLLDLGRNMGSSSPLKARAVLKKFWRQPSSSWDECFDRPYMFAI